MNHVRFAATAALLHLEDLEHSEEDAMRHGKTIRDYIADILCSITMLFSIQFSVVSHNC